MGNEDYSIQGWFDAGELYQRMAKQFPEGHFVEIGAWMGVSTRYMGGLIKDTKIVFDVVDHFRGEPESGYQQKVVKLYGGSIYEQFKLNMEKAECWTSINKVHIEYSNEAVKHYKDKSLDFVYIDASHDYESVYQDIKNWIKKVKEGGIIAGDDYNSFEEVKEAVNTFFKGRKLRFSGAHTWEYYVG